MMAVTGKGFCVKSFSESRGSEPASVAVRACPFGDFSPAGREGRRH
jgi:hypothetical protein